jgi:hypothetical protein
MDQQTKDKEKSSKERIFCRQNLNFCQPLAHGNFLTKHTHFLSTLTKVTHFTSATID